MKIADVLKPFRLYSARVNVRHRFYTGIMDVTVSAQNPQVARQLIRSQYGVEDYHIGSVREVK